MNQQAPIDQEDLMSLFYEAFEAGEDTNKLADMIVASTGLSLDIVGKIQAEASRVYAKNCF